MKSVKFRSGNNIEAITKSKIKEERILQKQKSKEDERIQKKKEKGEFIKIESESCGELDFDKLYQDSELKRLKKIQVRTLEERIKYKHHRLEITHITNKNKILVKLYDMYDINNNYKYKCLTGNGIEHIYERLEALFGLNKLEFFIEEKETELEEKEAKIINKVRDSKYSELYKKLCIYIDKYNVGMKFKIEKKDGDNINITLYTKEVEDSVDKIIFDGTSYKYYHNNKLALRKKILEDIFI